MTATPLPFSDDELRDLIRRARMVSKGAMDPLYDTIFDAESWLRSGETVLKGSREEIGLELYNDLQRMISLREAAQPVSPFAEIEIGDHVEKLNGYRFPGVVVSDYRTLRGDRRYVVECTAEEVDGCQHIFSPKDLILKKKGRKP